MGNRKQEAGGEVIAEDKEGKRKEMGEGEGKEERNREGREGTGKKKDKVRGEGRKRGGQIQFVTTVSEPERGLILKFSPHIGHFHLRGIGFYSLRLNFSKVTCTWGILAL